MKARCVKLRDVFSSMRFDGGYHNADVNVYDKVIRKHSQHTLDYYCSDIFTSGRTKRIYTEPEYGYPFLSNADVVSANPFQSCKYSSKKYGFDPNAVLKEGMILTGRVGAIGQTAFVPAFIEKAKAMGSDNIIRIVVKTSYRNGFIYAYLASKMGNLAFWKLATGGVQPFITDAMVGKLPIPVFPESFQAEVDNLIQESARLREEANDKLEEAHKKILSIIPHEDILPSNSISIKKIESSHNKRFDATYYNSKNRALYDYITTKKSFTTLGNLAEDIFRPGIFKREYVNNGVTFLGGADILRAVPSSDKKLSFRQVKKMPELIAKKGWILVTCGGTIGNTVYVDSQLEKCAISQHVMRIVPKESTLSGYLYAVLSSELGNKLINMFAFGSVIPQVEPHHLKHIPIPLFSEEEMASIDNQVKIYVSDIEMAKEKETRAIKMVEDEIEKWNKSN